MAASSDGLHFLFRKYKDFSTWCVPTKRSISHSSRAPLISPYVAYGAKFEINEFPAKLGQPFFPHLLVLTHHTPVRSMSLALHLVVEIIFKHWGLFRRRKRKRANPSRWQLPPQHSLHGIGHASKKWPGSLFPPRLFWEDFDRFPFTQWFLLPFHCPSRVRTCKKSVCVCVRRKREKGAFFCHWLVTPAVIWCGEWQRKGSTNIFLAPSLKYSRFEWALLDLREAMSHWIVKGIFHSLSVMIRPAEKETSKGIKAALDYNWVLGIHFLKPQIFTSFHCHVYLRSTRWERDSRRLNLQESITERVPQKFSP